MANYIVSDTSLTSVANAIRSRSGSSNQLSFPNGFVSAIASIPSGEGPVPVLENDVNFRDYDGTVVYSYSASDFANLTEMPANPNHTSENLTAQGWNWSLSDAKTRVATTGYLDIGQNYITTDGKTHIHIEIDPSAAESRRIFKLKWEQSAEAGVIVDWGDGIPGSAQTYSGTGVINAIHQYANGGSYDISLEVVDGKIKFKGDSGSTSSSTIYGGSAADNLRNSMRIRRIELGSNILENTISDYAFNRCYGLESITIPSYIETFGSRIFWNCTNLKSAVIPSETSLLNSGIFQNCHGLRSISLPIELTNIYSSSFQNCYRLNRVSIPDGITSILGDTFSNCYGITSLTIPATVEAVKAAAFSNCSGISEYHFLSTTPPRLENKNAFSSIASDCVIYVPYSEGGSVLSEYQASTNWSNYASYMREEV